MNLPHVVMDTINVQHTGSRSRRIHENLRRRDSRAQRTDSNSPPFTRPPLQGLSAYFSWEDVPSPKHDA